MYYITVKQPPMYHQMTLEEFLFGTNVDNQLINKNLTNTKTYEFENISKRFLDTVDVQELIQILTTFNEQTEHLRQKPRRELYYEFYIPKKSGGLRKIDAPEPELMDALRRLKTIFEENFKALYHTSAFAYVKGRCTISCIKRHQENESKWFGKYDLSNFFGSTTSQFVLQMFSMIFPFSEVIKDDIGKEEFLKAIDLAFLDGGLPQGTPISPTITNIMMIPVDFKLANGFRDFNNQRFLYTRYADDFQVSSKFGFDFREVEKFITDTLQYFGAPFKINSEKTRYGSSAGSNWNLGIMLNKDNEMTVGYKNKKRFQAMLSSYVMDKKHGINWEKVDVQAMDGLRNYYRSIEGDKIDKVVEHIGSKFGVNIIKMIKNDLKS